MEYLLNKDIKGYQLTDLLGTGGFGAVYRANQPIVGREVAVKVILPEFANAPMFIRRFETEAQLVARLEHPYIVPLYDYWRDANGAYIVMRYLRGGSLTKLIKKNGPLSVERASVLLNQIASALAVAHASGVVHRDLKPDNILLDEDGNHYLSDFGIAKDLGTPQDASITQTGTIIGSPAYLSPEQITGEELTPLSDVYTLGILLHYALTGEHPFPGKTPTAMLVHQMKDPMPPLQVRREGLPEALEDVLQRATEKNPVSRYKTVMELAIEFNRATQDTTASTSAVQRLTTSEASMLMTGINTDAVANPYKGLKAFEEADARDFFGREKLTERLLQRLAPKSEREDGDHLLVVVGPSGSGKSSVIKAGLLPKLRDGAVSGSDEWFYADMVPGAHPMEEMEAALLRVAINPPESLLRQLLDDERGLIRALKRIMPDDNTQFVLFIDQFEEVFTLTENETERRHFLNSLLLAVTEPRNRLRLIITLRADFYDRPLSYHAFGELVRNYTEVVLPLSPEELETAIAQPARRVGVSLETGLASAIVADVRDQPGALPLLQYALTQLFEERDTNKLTLAAYKAIGGAMGALAQRAEEIYQDIPVEAQAEAQQLFLRLVTLGEGTEDTRRRVTRSELNTLGSQEDMAQVIDIYGAQRLLTFDHDPQTREPTVEVAHEALIREWRRLRDWLDGAREALRTQRRLSQAAQEWKNANQDPSYLARGGRLNQFEALSQTNIIAMNQLEAAYLEASLHARTAAQQAEAERIAREEALEQAATQRLRLVVVVSSVAAVVAMMLAIFGFISQRQAVLARQEAEVAADIAVANEIEAEAVAQAANSLNLLDNYRPTLALGIVLEAAEARGDVTSVQQALSAVTYAPAPIAQFNPSDTISILAVDFAAHGEWIAAGTADGRILVRETAPPYTIVADFEAHTNDEPLPIYSVAHHPNADQIVAGDGNGTLTVWDTETGAVVWSVEEAHTGRITILRFSPDGSQILSGGFDTRAVLWDARNGEIVREFEGHVGEIFNADWATDAGFIVTSTGDAPQDADGNRAIDRRVRVYDVESGELMMDFHEAGTGWLRSVAITHDGNYAIVGSYDPNEFGGTIRVIDTTTGQVVRRLYGHTDVLTTLDISPDGTRIISGGWDKTVRVWSLATGAQLQRFDTVNDRILTARFSPDGQHALVTSGRDSGTADDPRALYYYLGNLAERLRLTGHENWLWGVAYSPDGTVIATGSGDLNLREQDNTVRLWDTTTGREIAQLTGHNNTVPALDFHPEGNVLASGSWDGDVILWDMGAFANVTRLLSFQAHDSAINDLDFSPDGEILLTAGSDGQIKLWNMRTQGVIRELEAHNGRVLRAKFSPNGELIATSGTDSMVRIWNTRTGEEIRALEGHTGWVSTVNFSPDGRYVVSGADNDLIVWDIETPLDQTPIYRVLVGHQGFVYGGDFSPDGRYIISGASDTSVRLWEVASGQEIRRFDDHTNWVLDVEFHPDGGEAVTVAEDNTARVWRIADSTEALIDWARENRYVPELTCAERERYNVKPLCDVLDGGGEGRGREDRDAANDD